MCNLPSVPVASSFLIYFWFIRYSTFFICLCYFFCCILTKSMVYNHNQVFFYFCLSSGFFCFRPSLWLLSYLSHFYPFLNFCFYRRPSQHVHHTFKSALFVFLFVCLFFVCVFVCLLLSKLFQRILKFGCVFVVFSLTRGSIQSWHIENVPLRNPPSCFHEGKSKHSSGPS